MSATQPQYRRISPTSQKIEYDYELTPEDSGEWRVRVTCAGAVWFEGYGSMPENALRLACDHMREAARGAP